MRGHAKPHDSLFKWVITAFLDDFFKLCFPLVNVSKFQLLDKEFYQRLGALDQSLEADLLIMADVEIDGVSWQMMILIELKSRRVMAMAQLHKYLLHACLISDRPVWPLLLYTDEGVWKAAVESSFPLAFHSTRGLNHVHCDIIRLQDFKSEELAYGDLLLGKLFALKADDRDCHREQLVREVYLALQSSPALDENQKLAADRFVTTYGKLTSHQIDTIKQEVDMKFMGNTITEYYTILGEERGEKRGEKRGERRGKLQGELSSYQRLLEDGLIDNAYYEKVTAPLLRALAELEKAPKPPRKNASKRPSP